MEYLLLKLSYFPNLTPIEEIIGSLKSNRPYADLRSTPRSHPDEPPILEEKRPKNPEPPMEAKNEIPPKSQKGDGQTEQEVINELKKDEKINSLLKKIKGRIISIENIEGGEDG